LSAEIAAAQLAIARLLREEEDPLRLAEGVARAAGVIVRARQVEVQLAEDARLSAMSAVLLRRRGLGEPRRADSAAADGPPPNRLALPDQRPPSR
jgi:hypothetical protein